MSPRYDNLKFYIRVISCSTNREKLFQWCRNVKDRFNDIGIDCKGPRQSTEEVNETSVYVAKFLLPSMDRVKEIFNIDCPESVYVEIYSSSHMNFSAQDVLPTGELKQNDAQNKQEVDSGKAHSEEESEDSTATEIDESEPEEGESNSGSANTTPTKAEKKLDKLREEATEAAVEEVPESVAASQTTKQEYTRSTEVREYVMKRADGSCEGCDEPAPFTSKTGSPYLHAHHLHELSDGGSDTPDTVIALCPNCHYRVHHGEDGDEYNEALQEKMTEIEM